MTIFDNYAARYERTKEEEMSMKEYLDLCKKDRLTYASAPERMLAAIGEPTLFDYLPADALLVIDESHVSVPQVGARLRQRLRFLRLLRQSAATVRRADRGRQQQARDPDAGAAPGLTQI